MFAKTFLQFAVTLLVTVACANDRTNATIEVKVGINAEASERSDEIHVPKESVANNGKSIAKRRKADETFDDFIFQFINSPDFQMQHISFPLHRNAFGDDFVVKRDEWKHQTLFDGRDYYTVFFNFAKDAEIAKSTGLEVAHFENINLKDSLMRILRFDKQADEWKLTRELFKPLEEHPIASFLNFYKRFVSDSLFQQQSLVGTINYSTIDPENDFGHIEGTIMSAQWEVFAPELPVDHITNIDYGQTFDDPDHIVLMKRSVANGMFEELEFRKIDGEWKLIAYEN